MSHCLNITTYCYRHLKRIAAIVIVCICVTAIFFAINAPTKGMFSRVVHGNQKRKLTGVMNFQLTPFGFEPSEASGSKGLYFFRVANRSGLEDMPIRLESENGNRLHDVNITRKQLNWQAVTDLQPGNYTLSVPGQPRWVCHIRIIAK